MSHYLADSIVENIRYITLMHVRASHRVFIRWKMNLFVSAERDMKLYIYYTTD